VIYLVILFLVGGVGIGSLLVQQRRERAHLQTADTFLSSLEKIAPEARPGPFAESRVPRSRPVPTGRSRKARVEARRRAAARKRLEARRRARQTAGRSRAAAVARTRARSATPRPRPSGDRQSSEIRRRVPQQERPARVRRVS
jgi:hypothetical protein